MKLIPVLSPSMRTVPRTIVTVACLSVLAACNGGGEVSVTPQPDSPCFRHALATRTVALTKAYDDYHTANVTALKKRQDAELAAWKIAGAAEREKAFFGIAATYQKEYNTSNFLLTVAKQTAWNAFGNENRTCAAGS